MAAAAAAEPCAGGGGQSPSREAQRAPAPDPGAGCDPWATPAVPAARSEPAGPRRYPSSATGRVHWSRPRRAPPPAANPDALLAQHTARWDDFLAAGSPVTAEAVPWPAELIELLCARRERCPALRRLRADLHPDRLMGRLRPRCASTDDLAAVLRLATLHAQRLNAAYEHGT
eukprot:TRINITY_DN70990_c0_g1_i1.p2 TRINITY_DN70990_c0_g1~~TRINITY_DN70990_c0_g1_i1.p2  ORF type:complete len:173 (+),score=32.90 TRINITY_DN70990_c0_g1_i1:59-577(+)